MKQPKKIDLNNFFKSVTSETKENQQTNQSNIQTSAFSNINSTNSNIVSMNSSSNKFYSKEGNKLALSTTINPLKVSSTSNARKSKKSKQSVDVRNSSSSNYRSNPINSNNVIIDIVDIIDMNQYDSGTGIGISKANEIMESKVNKNYFKEKAHPKIWKTTSTKSYNTKQNNLLSSNHNINNNNYNNTLNINKSIKGAKSCGSKNNSNNFNTIGSNNEDTSPKVNQLNLGNETKTNNFNNNNNNTNIVNLNLKNIANGTINSSSHNQGINSFRKNSGTAMSNLNSNLKSQQSLTSSQPVNILSSFQNGNNTNNYINELATSLNLKDAKEKDLKDNKDKSSISNNNLDIKSSKIKKIGISPQSKEMIMAKQIFLSMTDYDKNSNNTNNLNSNINYTNNNPSNKQVKSTDKAIKKVTTNILLNSQSIPLSSNSLNKDYSQTLRQNSISGSKSTLSNNVINYNTNFPINTLSNYNSTGTNTSNATSNIFSNNNKSKLSKNSHIPINNCTNTPINIKSVTINDLQSQGQVTNCYSISPTNRNPLSQINKIATSITSSEFNFNKEKESVRDKGKDNKTDEKNISETKIAKKANIKIDTGTANVNYSTNSCQINPETKSSDNNEYNGNNTLSPNQQFINTTTSYNSNKLNNNKEANDVTNTNKTRSESNNFNLVAKTTGNSSKISPNNYNNNINSSKVSPNNNTHGNSSKVSPNNNASTNGIGNSNNSSNQNTATNFFKSSKINYNNTLNNNAQNKTNLNEKNNNTSVKPNLIVSTNNLTSFNSNPTSSNSNNNNIVKTINMNSVKVGTNNSNKINDINNKAKNSLKSNNKNYNTLREHTSSTTSNKNKLTESTEHFIRNYTLHTKSNTVKEVDNNNLQQAQSKFNTNNNINSINNQILVDLDSKYKENIQVKSKDETIVNKNITKNSKLDYSIEPNYLKLFKKKSNELYRKVSDKEKEKIKKELFMDSHILNSIINFKQLLSKDTSSNKNKLDKVARKKLKILKKELDNVGEHYDDYSIINNKFKSQELAFPFNQTTFKQNFNNYNSNSILSEENTDQEDESQEVSNEKIIIDANMIGKKNQELKLKSEVKEDKKLDKIKNKVETKQLKLNLPDNTVSSIQTPMTNKALLTKEIVNSTNNNSSNPTANKFPYISNKYEVIYDEVKTKLTEELILNSDIRLKKYDLLFQFINNNLKETLDLITNSTNDTMMFKNNVINKSKSFQSSTQNQNIIKNDNKFDHKIIEKGNKKEDLAKNFPHKSINDEEDLANVSNNAEENVEDSISSRDNDHYNNNYHYNSKDVCKEQESEFQLLNISKELAKLDKQKNESGKSSIGLSKMSSYFKNRNVTATNDSINIEQEVNKEDYFNNDYNNNTNKKEKTPKGPGFTKNKQIESSEKGLVNKIPKTKGSTKLKYQRNLFSNESYEDSFELKREEDSYIDKLNKISNSILESINNGSIAFTEFNLDKDALNGFIDESINVLGNISNDISSINFADTSTIYPNYNYYHNRNRNKKQSQGKSFGKLFNDLESKNVSRQISENLGNNYNDVNEIPSTKPSMIIGVGNNAIGPYRKKNARGSNKSIKITSHDFNNTSNITNLTNIVVQNNFGSICNNVNIIKKCDYNNNNLKKKETLINKVSDCTLTDNQTNNNSSNTNNIQIKTKRSDEINDDLDDTVENIPVINKSKAKKYSLVLNNLDKIKQMSRVQVQKHPNQIGFETKASVHLTSSKTNQHRRQDAIKLDNSCKVNYDEDENEIEDKVVNQKKAVHLNYKLTNKKIETNNNNDCGEAKKLDKDDPQDKCIIY